MEKKFETTVIEKITVSSGLEQQQGSCCGLVPKKERIADARDASSDVGLGEVQMMAFGCSCIHWVWLRLLIPADLQQNSGALVQELLVVLFVCLFLCIAVALCRSSSLVPGPGGGWLLSTVCNPL